MLQLEIGSFASAYETEPYEITLQKCLRYYWNNGPGYDAYRPFGIHVVTGSTYGRCDIYYPVKMRIQNPTVTFIGSFGLNYPGVILTSANLSVANISAWAVAIGTTFTGGTGGQASSMYASGDTTAAIIVDATL